MADRKLYLSDRPKNSLFTPDTRRPYCPGRPKELCFTTLSPAMETMGMRLRVVKQSFFGPPGQYGRLVTRANSPNRTNRSNRQASTQVPECREIFPSVANEMEMADRKLF